ncbi:uncharacterized protein LOC144907110 [Branchiostoma floridae x Branchiostoma belcheri]
MNSENYEKPEVNGGKKRKRKRRRRSDYHREENPREQSNLSVKGDEAGDMQEAFDKVINGVSHKWDDLARKLGFSENQIDGIHNSKIDQDRRCREMLRRWRNKNGKKATLQVLKQALIDIDERLTAESLEGKKTKKKRKRKRKMKVEVAQEENTTVEPHVSSLGNYGRTAKLC